MSAMPLALLVTTAATGAVGVAVLRTLMGCADRSPPCTPSWPRATPPPRGHRAGRPQPAADADEIRAAVAEALAEERERELAEARAFWAAQEARDASDAPSLLGPARQTSCSCPARPISSGLEPPGAGHRAAARDAERVRRRVPRSWPRPAAATPRTRTSCRSSSPDVRRPRAHGRHAWRSWPRPQAELADVRPGPLGTLDVYVFADGTTLCMTPGHRETAERLAAALRDGADPGPARRLGHLGRVHA